MGDFEFVAIDGPSRGQSLTFPGPRFFVGSAPECQVRLEGANVAPKHAEVRLDTKGVPWVRDLSSGRLLLNGEAVQEGVLTEGCFVRFGDVELVVRLRGRANPSGTMATPTPMRSVTGVRAPASGTRIKSIDSIEPPIDSTTRRPTPFSRSQAAAQPPPREEVREVRAGALPPGTVIDGRYHIVRKLAAGGMGEVYRAEHVELGKAFALKVMLPDLSRDPEFVTRFKREAIAASRIGQQNIVDISDFGQTSDGRFYFVMEYLDGLTLASLIHREGALDSLRATNIGLQVGRALAAAHAQSIVHRDLKPENIMLLQRPGQPDFVKVLDFGVAKVSSGQGQGGQTAIGMVVGTPQYMSPEQAKAIVVDARSDIYSFGLILYELISGRPTFAGETPSILMVKHVTEAPPPLGHLEGLPVELETLIFQMLEKEPEARPQTMEQVVSVLDSLHARLKSNDSTLERTTGGGAPTAPEPGVSGVAVRVSGGQRAVVSSGSNPRVGGSFQRAAERSNSQQEVADDFVAPPKSKAPLVLGAVVILAVLAGGAYFATKGTEPTPPPKPPEREQPLAAIDAGPSEAERASAVVPPPVAPIAQVEKAKLRIETVPTGAEVMEGDVLLGNTPLDLVRPADKPVELTFSLKGYNSITKKLGFATAEMTIELEKKKEVTRPAVKRPAELPDDPYKNTDDLKDNPFK